MQKNSPATVDLIVMGRWTHGGFSRGDGERGQRDLCIEAWSLYREKIEFPFFAHYLKAQAESGFPKAWVFETGMNQWRKYDAWLPRNTPARRSWFWNSKPGQGILEA